MSVMLPTRHDTLTALHQVLCRLEERLAGPPVDSDEFFGYRPLPLAEFLAGMKAVGEPCGRFLDLGCGVGTKLLIAHYLGWSELVGVEHDPALVELAGELVSEAEIVEADAFEFDCSGFNVVYTYRICQSLDRQDALGLHIAATADPGTVVLYAGADMPCGDQVAPGVWRV